MADRQHGAVRDRGSAARGHTRMRMDDPSFNNSKRKREEEGDPVLHLLSLVLRIGDRLRVSNSQLLFRTVSLACCTFVDLLISLLLISARHASCRA